MSGILLFLLALTGCGEPQPATPDPADGTTPDQAADGTTPATTPDEPGPLGMTAGAGPECVVQLGSDVQVAVEDTPEGAALVLSGGENVARDAARIAEAIDQQSGQQGASTVTPQGGSAASVDELQAPTEDAELLAMPSMDAEAEEQQGSARIVLTPTGPSTPEQVQGHARVIAQRIQNGDCPLLLTGSP